MAQGTGFLIISWNIISISKNFMSIIKYRIVSDDLLMKLSVIVLFAKSSLSPLWHNGLAVQPESSTPISFKNYEKFEGKSNPYPL